VNNVFYAIGVIETKLIFLNLKHWQANSFLSLDQDQNFDSWLVFPFYSICFGHGSER